MIGIGIGHTLRNTNMVTIIGMMNTDRDLEHPITTEVDQLMMITHLDQDTTLTVVDIQLLQLILVDIQLL